MNTPSITPENGKSAVNALKGAFTRVNWLSTYHYAARCLCLSAALLCLLHLKIYVDLYQWGALLSTGLAASSLVFALMAFATEGLTLFVVTCFAVLTALAF
ncbi:MAG: hypothetical protein WAT29_02180 [Thiolinea sp.]